MDMMKTHYCICCIDENLSSFKRAAPFGKLLLRALDKISSENFAHSLSLSASLSRFYSVISL